MTWPKSVLCLSALLCSFSLMVFVMEYKRDETEMVMRVIVSWFEDPAEATALESTEVAVTSSSSSTTSTTAAPPKQFALFTHLRNPYLKSSLLPSIFKTEEKSLKSNTKSMKSVFLTRPKIVNFKCSFCLLNKNGDKVVPCARHRSLILQKMLTSMLNSSSNNKTAHHHKKSHHHHEHQHCKKYNNHCTCNNCRSREKLDKKSSCSERTVCNCRFCNNFFRRPLQDIRHSLCNCKNKQACLHKKTSTTYHDF